MKITSTHIIIISIIIILVIILIRDKNRKKNKKENFDEINYTKNKKITYKDLYGNYFNIPKKNNVDRINYVVDKYIDKKHYEDEIEDNNLFNMDYIDINEEYNNLTQNNKVIFNNDEIEYTISTNIDEEEKYIIDKMVKDFIDNINNRLTGINIDFNNISIWKNTSRQEYEDGFEKVRKELGIPEKLYNEGIKGTKINLIEYSNITKYETDKEVKYIVDVKIGRDKSKIEQIIKIHFTFKKNDIKNVVIEKINILGYVSKVYVKQVYQDINNYYDFKNLDDNNLFDSKNIIKELDTKYMIREKLMQEQIDNLHPDDKDAHMYINPEEYESYKTTQTIYDDILEDEKFNIIKQGFKKEYQN